ncbi:MAG TPA: outer membrane lipoprotein carrier protein LolA [Pseudolabrys sp.]
MAAAALLAVLTVTPALAQSVPLPTPRPPVGSNARIAAPAVTGSVLARNETPSAPRPPSGGAIESPDPITNPFAALLGRAGPAANLTPEQRAIIDKVNNYLSSMQTLEGQFVQVGPDGSRSQGEFYIAKPGRVRFEYDAPSTIELVADGQSVVVRDRRLATQDVYPLSQTPLRFLLSDHVDLMKDAGLVAVYADDVFVTAVVEEKNGLVGTSRLMIMFSAKDMQLKQWTVTDPQGFDTTVAVYNLDASKRPDPAMFRIDYNKYKN